MVSKELIAGSSRALVLGILSRGENYGYAIMQQVRQLSGGKLAYSEGMLYPVLHRLEREGLIHSRWGESESGRRRKYYRLSRQGGAALQNERTQWLSVHNTLAQLWGVRPCPI